MTITGMLIALFILILFSYFMGPYGAGILLIILFGVVFSTHRRTKQINEDLKLIKAKLGLLNEEEKEAIEIQNNIKEYARSEADPEFRSKINEEIEEELENYINENENKDNKNKWRRGNI